jgi:hypothetical protein
MEKNEAEHCHDHAEEFFVVFIAHAIIKPSAVMIKVAHTSIARATVFGI